MKFYGNYKPENNQICIPIAIAQTLTYLSRLIYPNLHAHVLFEPWVSADRDNNVLLGYCHYNPEVNKDAPAKYHEERPLINIFGITPDITIWKSYFDRVHPDDFWLHFWTIIAHEVRHLIQDKTFQFDKSKMFSEDDLPRFAKHYQKHYPIIEHAHKRLEGCDYSPHIIILETDAEIIEVMTISIIANALTEDGFDEYELVKHLLRPATEFTDDAIKVQGEKVGRFDVDYSFETTFAIPEGVKMITTIPE